jgi:hypothetical protein
MHLKFFSPSVFLVQIQMTLEFKIKNTVVFSIVLERKYELTVLNLNSKIISKHIFLHIVMIVALFYTHNRSESSTFLHEKS